MIKTVLVPGAPWPSSPVPFKRKQRYLSTAQAQEVRDLRAAGITRQALARKHNMCVDAIDNVIRRRGAYAVP